MWRVVLGSVMIASAATAAAAETDPDFGGTLNDIRAAERVIRAALQTGDGDELTRQSNGLLRIQTRLMDGSDPSDQRRWACGNAAGDLSATASAARRVWIGAEPAQSLVSAEKFEQSYRKYLAACEQEIRKADRRRSR